MNRKETFSNHGVNYAAFVRWCKRKGISAREALQCSKLWLAEARLISLRRKLKNQ